MKSFKFLVIAGFLIGLQLIESKLEGSVRFNEKLINPKNAYYRYEIEEAFTDMFDEEQEKQQIRNINTRVAKRKAKKLALVQAAKDQLKLDRLELDQIAISNELRAEKIKA